MTNTQSLGTIEATNPVLAVAPLKEETEMRRDLSRVFSSRKYNFKIII